MLTFKMDYYAGEDRYSDGDIEEEILQYIKENDPDDYASVLKDDQRFPVVYHLSAYRQHLLDWFPFRKDAELLEIGGGMGAFTHMFCERCGHVTTVELSKRRAEAIRMRCRDIDNLELYVGDVMSIPLVKKYDYITVLGVLEYQRVYSKSATPELDFLQKLKKLLKPGGTLFVAIENKMGLKYWCGDVEDHCGIPFASINNYAHGGNARTFDRQELKELLENSGFDTPAFYYPLPDYKFPRIIYSDQYLPRDGVNSCMLPNYYAGLFHTQYPIVADERALYPSIAKNNVFPYFANSFLAICSMPSEAQGIRFVSTTAERNPEYLIRTVIKDQTVYKEPVFEPCLPHIKQAYESIQKLKRRGLSVISHQLEGNTLVTPYIEEPTVEDVLINLIVKEDLEHAHALTDLFYQNIKQSSDEARISNPLLGAIWPEPLLKHAFCDMIFSNAFLQNDKIAFYDQEWTFQALPASFVLYRAFKVLYSANAYLNKHVSFQHWLECYGLLPYREKYDEIEGKLFAPVQNQAICEFVGKLRKLPVDTIKNNLSYLTTAEQSLNQYEQDIVAYQEGLKQQQIDITTLKTALNQRSDDVATMEAALNQRAKDVEVLEEALSQRSDDVATMEAALNQRAKDVEVLEAALSQRSSDVATMEAALDQRAKDVAVLEAALSQRSNDVATMEAALDQRAKDVEVLETALNQRSDDVATMEAALDQRAMDVAVLEAALSQRNNDVTAMEVALDQRAKDVEVLENTLTERGTEITNLEDTIQQMKIEAQMLRENVSILTNKLRRIEETGWYKAVQKMKGILDPKGRE